MIFVGDIALPFKHAVRLKSLPPAAKDKRWFGNFEGAVVDGNEQLKRQLFVFNDREAVRRLLKDLNFVGFAAANNHIFDTGSLADTLEFFKEIAVPFVGIGNNLSEAAKPLVLKEGSREVVILNFGWEVIQCEITKGAYAGVNPLTKKHVIQSAKEALRAYPHAHVLAFMHWSYELEAEPQPFERELAKRLIDIGLSGVIGCHPHRIGGFEVYKGKPIVYSLGNWMFRQQYYHNGKLQFPDFCKHELAFEWDFETGAFSFHFFEYDKGASTLVYKHTEGEDSETMAAYTPFRSLSDTEYRDWYKTHHYHKNKGLPIYYWEDSQTKIFLKNKLNAGRDILVRQLARLR